MLTSRISQYTANLIKQMGWETNTFSHCWVKTLDGEIIHNRDRKSIPEHDRCEVILMQPTMIEVIEWIWEMRGIWISFRYDKKKSIFITYLNSTKLVNSKDCKSVTESFDSVIEYLFYESEIEKSFGD